MNYIIVTEDDPRDEDPKKKLQIKIKSGIQNTLHVFVQDRYEAIHQAISSAQEGDTVLLLGKGDESFIYRENGRAPWVGDNVAAKECIQAKFRLKIFINRLALYEIFDIIFLLILGREVCEYAKSRFIKENEGLDDALRRFKRQVSRNGTLAEARKREFYVKPGVTQKVKI